MDRRVPLSHINANAPANKAPGQQYLMRYKERQDEFEAETSAVLKDLEQKQKDFASLAAEQAKQIQSLQHSIIANAPPSPVPISTTLKFDSRLRTLESSRSVHDIQQQLESFREQLKALETPRNDPLLMARLTAVSCLVEDLETQVIRLKSKSNLSELIGKIQRLERRFLNDDQLQHNLSFKGSIAELRDDVERLRTQQPPLQRQVSLAEDIEALRKRFDAEIATPNDLSAAVDMLTRLQRKRTEYKDNFVAQQQTTASANDTTTKSSAVIAPLSTRASCAPATPATAPLLKRKKAKSNVKRKSLGTTLSLHVDSPLGRRSRRECKPKQRAAGMVDWTKAHARDIDD